MFCLVSHGGGAAGPVRVHAHLSPRHGVPLRYADQGATTDREEARPDI